MKRLAILLALFAPINGLRADSSMPAAEYANTQLPDPEKEKAARELMESIRCLVCQGQSIADFPTPIWRETCAP